MNEEFDLRCGADLALIDTAVVRLTRVDLQAPVLVRVRQRRQRRSITIRFTSIGVLNKVGLVSGPEAQIGRVQIRSHRQQVCITMADPRHLSTKSLIVSYISISLFIISRRSLLWLNKQLPRI